MELICIFTFTSLFFAGIQQEYTFLNSGWSWLPLVRAIITYANLYFIAKLSISINHTTYSTLTVEPFHILRSGCCVLCSLYTWQMLMSVKERGRDHAVSMPAALIPLARTRAAVSVVTWWAQEGARVCQHMCVWERMYSMCVRLHVGSRVSHMTIQPVVVCP